MWVLESPLLVWFKACVSGWESLSASVLAAWLPTSQVCELPGMEAARLIGKVPACATQLYTLVPWGQQLAIVALLSKGHHLCPFPVLPSPAAIRKERYRQLGTSEHGGWLSFTLRNARDSVPRHAGGPGGAGQLGSPHCLYLERGVACCFQLGRRTLFFDQ